MVLKSDYARYIGLLSYYGVLFIGTKPVLGLAGILGLTWPGCLGGGALEVGWNRYCCVYCPTGSVFYISFILSPGIGSAVKISSSLWSSNGIPALLPESRTKVDQG